MADYWSGLSFKLKFLKLQNQCQTTDCKVASKQTFMAILTLEIIMLEIIKKQF